MIISDKKINEKIPEFYLNNQQIKNMSKFEKECLQDIIKQGLEHIDKVDIEKGGIYIEVNEDPRGWIFGNKTRILYIMKTSYIILLNIITGLTLDVKTTPYGGAVNVVVKNPDNIDRMLLSQNDDVGSSIQYADISVPIVQLTANHGTHICIEPFSTRQSIRVHIYPGVNVPNISES